MNDINKMKDLVKLYLGLDLYAYKEAQLNRRLQYFIDKHKIKDVSKYCLSLQTDDKERERFISHVTINVTKFFRDVEFFNHLKNELSKYPRNKKIKVWSAACSYGCEPYTLAIILNELGFTNFEIVATDIDSEILKQAGIGIFTEADIKDVPSNLLSKYFTKVSENYHVSQLLKDKIKFKRHNLLTNTYETGFDLIVCRNVVIYFTTEAKRDIYERFHPSLNEEGILFVGPTEHIANYKELGYKQLRPCLYKKANNL